MLNRDRHHQFVALMAERGWDLLIFYGDTWRKDHLRCLLNVNFSGPQAVAILSRDGEVRAIVTDPWDLEPVGACIDGRATLALRLTDGLRAVLAKDAAAVVAINGMEQAASPCANLSDWGQKLVSKLDFGYVDPHKAEHMPDQKLMMVNALSPHAADMTHAMKGEDWQKPTKMPRQPECC